jgi:hypothetical protein
VRKIKPVDGCGVCKFREVVSLHKYSNVGKYLICSLTRVGIPCSLYNAITRGATLISCPLRGY